MQQLAFSLLQTHPAPMFSKFLLHLFRVGMAWHVVDIYNTTIAAYLDCIIMTRLHIILSFL